MVGAFLYGVVQDPLRVNSPPIVVDSEVIITFPVTESTSNTVFSLAVSQPVLTDSFLGTWSINVLTLNSSPWSSTPSPAGVPSSREIIT